MRVALASTGLILLALAGCDDEPEAPDPTSVSVCDVAGGDAPSGNVLIEGEATDLNKVNFGFALSADGCSVFVAAPAKETLDVDSGDSVELRGNVRTLSEAEAERLRFALDRRPQGVPLAVPEGLAVDAGDPFVNAYGLLGI